MGDIIKGKLFYSTNGIKKESATHMLGDYEVTVTTCSYGARGLTVEIGGEKETDMSPGEKNGHANACKLEIALIRATFTSSTDPHLEDCEYTIELME